MGTRRRRDPRDISVADALISALVGPAFGREVEHGPLLPGQTRELQGTGFGPLRAGIVDQPSRAPLLLNFGGMEPQPDRRAAESSLTGPITPLMVQQIRSLPASERLLAVSGVSGSGADEARIRSVAEAFPDEVAELQALQVAGPQPVEITGPGPIPGATVQLPARRRNPTDPFAGIGEAPPISEEIGRVLSGLQFAIFGDPIADELFGGSPVPARPGELFGGSPVPARPGDIMPTAGTPGAAPGGFRGVGASGSFDLPTPAPDLPTPAPDLESEKEEFLRSLGETAPPAGEGDEAFEQFRTQAEEILNRIEERAQPQETSGAEQIARLLGSAAAGASQGLASGGDIAGVLAGAGAQGVAELAALGAETRDAEQRYRDLLDQVDLARLNFEQGFLDTTLERQRLATQREDIALRRSAFLYENFGPPKRRELAMDALRRHEQEIRNDIAELQLKKALDPFASIEVQVGDREILLGSYPEEVRGPLGAAVLTTMYGAAPDDLAYARELLVGTEERGPVINEATGRSFIEDVEEAEFNGDVERADELRNWALIKILYSMYAESPEEILNVSKGRSLNQPLSFAPSQ